MSFLLGIMLIVAIYIIPNGWDVGSIQFTPLYIYYQMSYVRKGELREPPMI